MNGYVTRSTLDPIRLNHKEKKSCDRLSLVAPAPVRFRVVHNFTWGAIDDKVGHIRYAWYSFRSFNSIQDYNHTQERADLSDAKGISRRSCVKASPSHARIYTSECPESRFNQINISEYRMSTCIDDTSPFPRVGDL